MDEAVVGPPPPLPPLPPLTPIERRAFDCSGLEADMAFADEAVSNAQRALVYPGRGSSTPVAAREPPAGDARLAADEELDDREALSHVPLEAARAGAIPLKAQNPGNASELWTW